MLGSAALEAVAATGVLPWRSLQDEPVVTIPTPRTVAADESSGSAQDFLLKAYAAAMRHGKKRMSRAAAEAITVAEVKKKGGFQYARELAESWVEASPSVSPLLWCVWRMQEGDRGIYMLEKAVKHRWMRATYWTEFGNGVQRSSQRKTVSGTTLAKQWGTLLRRTATATTEQEVLGIAEELWGEWFQVGTTLAEKAEAEAAAATAKVVALTEKLDPVLWLGAWTTKGLV